MVDQKEHRLKKEGKIKINKNIFSTDIQTGRRIAF